MPSFNSFGAAARLRNVERVLPAHLLTGIWLYKNDSLLGGYESYTLLQPDGHEFQIVHTGKSDTWCFSESTWKVSGKTLTEVGVRATNSPWIAIGHPSTTETISLDGESYVYRGGDGDIATEIKVDRLPDIFRKKLDEFVLPVPLLIHP